MRAPAHGTSSGPWPRWLALARVGLMLAIGGLACGDDGGSEPAPPALASAADLAADEGEPAPWAERLAEPSVSDLLAALAQPHAVVREHVGAHQLTTTLDVELGDPGAASAAGHDGSDSDADDDEPEPAPRVPAPPLDAPVVPNQAVHDELELRVLPTPEHGLRLSLSQANDHDRGREVVLVDETVHVRHAHRPWFHHPRDGDLIELWLDDAQHSVHDAVQLAAPRLALQATAVPNAGLQGGPAVEITLTLADREDPSLVAAGPTQGWRAAAEIEAVEGTVRLDAASGAWLTAAVDVRYRLPAADGRALQGHLRLRAQLAPGWKGAIEAPEGSRPLPPRLRYDDEQQRLLDGLAAP